MIYIVFMNESISIAGGVPAVGSLICGGSKNLALKIIVASILTRSKCRIENIPNILDVVETLHMCEDVGAEVQYDGHVLFIDSAKLSNSNINLREVGGRVSLLYLSVLIHYFDTVSVPLPKGCALGARGIDLHLNIFKKFGLQVDAGAEKCTLIKMNKLCGTIIELNYPSVGATETALLLSVLASGKSVIKGIANEPEIHYLVLFLQQCGAEIYYTGERELTVEGVEKLNGCDFKVAGDRIEAAGWACMACATNGSIEVDGIEIEQLQTFLGPFMGIGGGFTILDRNKVRFFRKDKLLKPIFVETGPYPMFSTDYQPMLAILMSQANGSSVIHETLFSNRLTYLETLKLFGVLSTASDHCYGRTCRFGGQNYDHSTVITGNTSLTAPSQPIYADTIRSGFAYLISAAIANGSTKINNLKIVKRGIEKLEKKLNSLGMNILLQEN